ncbi:hypothetical protein E2C01_042365 [Portunus trituberculatus]|uniref:Secreted protein n=1 Tax=Portunus trituberculatus TaxID=210409 RepID=A0A5B7FUL2_PORTR|nr:hypothetical protein [Portunus trituberculatus]
MKKSPRTRLRSAFISLAPLLLAHPRVNHIWNIHLFLVVTHLGSLNTTSATRSSDTNVPVLPTLPTLLSVAATLPSPHKDSCPDYSSSLSHM